MCRTEKRIDHRMVLSLKNVPGHLIPRAWKSFPDIPTHWAQRDKGQGSPLCWWCSTNICTKCSQTDDPLHPTDPKPPSLTHAPSHANWGRGAWPHTQPRMKQTHTIKTHNSPAIPPALHPLFYISPKSHLTFSSIRMQTQPNHFPLELFGSS